MHETLIWTINDFPTYAILSGSSTKGKFVCPCYTYGTISTNIKPIQKMFYMDHCVFLPLDHPWSSNKRSFTTPSLTFLKGTKVLYSLQYFENVFGKKKNINDCLWKKMSIFF